MKTWEECCSEVGYNPMEYNPPVQQYKWFAYKDGNAIECNSQTEAMFLSKNFEKVKDLASKETIEMYWENRRDLEGKAADVWEASLRNEFEDVPVSIYNLCYNKAYEDNHSEGRDSVYYKISEYMDFVTVAARHVNELGWKP